MLLIHVQLYQSSFIYPTITPHALILLPVSPTALFPLPFSEGIHIGCPLVVLPLLPALSVVPLRLTLALGTIPIFLLESLVRATGVEMSLASAGGLRACSAALVA